MADAAARSVRSMEEVRASLNRQREAQAQARVASLQEISAIQQKITIQRQVITGTISHAQATRQMAEADIFARTGSRQLAQQLAATRAEFEKNAAAMRNLNTEARASGSSFSSLKTNLAAAAASFVSFQGVTKFIEIADDVQSLRARIENLSTAAGQGATIFERLQSSAKALGIPLQANVEFFTQLSFAAQGLGKSNADLLQIADTLQKVGAVSKISADNMAGALLQLGQVFAQGKFQADELNVILTRAPAIVELIAEGLGKSTKETLNLARAGKLEVNEVLDAILRRSDEVGKKFAEIPQTVGRASAAAAVTIGQAIDAMNQKFGITQTIAENILALTSRISQALNLDTQAEKLARLKQQLAELQADQAKIQGGGIGGFFTGVLRGPELQQNIDTLIAQIAELEAATKKADAALSTTAEVVKSQYTPAQIKAAEEIRKHNERLKEQGDTLNLSGEKLAEYHRAATLAATGDKALADETYRLVLALEQEKQKKDAATKATHAKAEADRKAAQAEKERLADVQKANALINQLNEKKRQEDQKEEEANAKSLAQLDQELQAIQEEGRLINASLAPKEEVARIEGEIARARIERQYITELTAASEDTLTEAEAAWIEQLRKARLANLEAAESVDRYKESLDDAALSTEDLKTFTQGILSGTQSIGNLFKDLGQTMGVRLVEGVLFGKGQNEKEILGNFNQLLGGDAAGIFGQQGFNLGSTFIDSLSSSVSSLGQSVGLDFGSMFGSSAADAAGVTWEQAAPGVFEAGNAPMIAASSGMSFGSIFGAAAAGAAGMSMGKGLAGAFGLSGGSANLGGTIGGVAGGIGGAILGAPFGPAGMAIGSALGAAAGSLFGSFIGSLFQSTPSKGTQIRKEVKSFLKDIEVSFASELDTNEYFFEESKKLANKMFGGDFLAASKQILTDKAGPELSKQLQALGTFITGDQAQKIGKSVEQAGTTFGNMLLDNLGLDPEVIDDAMQEIIQKAGITFESLTEKLNDLFADEVIGVEFYKDTIMGAVEIFSQDIPAAVNVAKIALQSFSEEGIFDIEKFQESVVKASATFDVITEAFIDAVQNNEPGIEIGKLVGEQIMAGLEQLAVNQFLTTFIEEQLFEGIDLSDGLGADELEKIVQRAGVAREEVEKLWDAFGGPGKDETKDDLEDIQKKLEELWETLRSITQERFDLRINVLSDLESIGAISGAEGARARIGAQGGRLQALGASTRTDFTDAELDQALDAIREMRRATVELFQAMEQEEQDALEKRIRDIKKDYDERRESLKKEAEAAQDAAEARLKQLADEKEATQDLFQERLDGLRDELQVAQDFRQAAKQLQSTIDQIVLSTSPFSDPEKFSFTQRRAAELRAALATAPQERRPELIQELSQVLQDQLSLGQKLLDPQQFGSLFRDVMAELEQNRDEATAQGDRVELIQQEIASTSAQMEASLRSIDLRAEQVRADAEAQQQAFKDQAEALSLQEQAAIDAAEAETSARIDQLRLEAVQEIINLGKIEDAILAEQQRRVQEQLDLSAEQVRILGSIDGGIFRLEESLTGFFDSITSAKYGYEGITTGKQLFLAHPGEYVKITPAGQQSTGPISVTVPLTIGVASGGNTPAATEEAIIQAVADDLRRGGKIRTAIKGIK